jgi:hypothetical protein
MMMPPVRNSTNSKIPDSAVIKMADIR